MKKKFTMLFAALLAFVGVAKAQLVETSTAEAPKYYVIASYNRGGYLTLENSTIGTGATHVALAEGSYWYFEAADNGGVNFVNKLKGEDDAKIYLGSDKTASATAATWYVLENGVNKKGLSISSTAAISAYNCIDANNNNNGVGGWHPSANDWQGTTWVFVEAATLQDATYNPEGLLFRTRADRYVTSVALNGGFNNSAVVNHDYKGNNGLVYNDLTKTVTMKAVAGEEVTASITRDGKWTNAYVYIDYDNDGFTAGINEEDGFTPAEDLVSYSFYSGDETNGDSGKNSAGDELTGDPRNTISLPSFEAPAAPGTYRMRFKIDWNSINPNGGNSNFMTDGGSFIDVTLEVVSSTIDVVYTYKYNGEVKFTQTSKAVVGDEFPALNQTLPYGVTATKPAGNIAESDVVDGKVAKDIEITNSLPFVAAADYASIKNWYYIQMHSNAQYTKYLQAATDYIEWADATMDASAADTYTWSFIGNPFDGFKLVNRSTGETQAVNSTGSGNPALGNIETATSWTIKASRTNPGAQYFCFQYPGSNNYMNAQSGKVAFWDDNDNGSTMWVTERDLSGATELLALIESANAMANALSESTGVGSVTSESLAALVSEIEKAQAAADAKEGCIEAQVTLQAAIDGLVTVQPEEGKFYTIASAMPESDGRSGKMMYVNADGGMQFDNNEEKYYIFQFVSAGEGKFYLYNVENDSYLNTAKGHNGGQAEAKAFATAGAKAVTITNMGRSNAVKIVPEGGAMLHAQAAGSSVVAWNNDENAGASAWTIAEVEFSLTDLNHTLTVSEAGWATLVLGYNTTIPAEVTAYAVSEVKEGYVTLAEVENEKNVLPAHTPVLIEAAAGEYVFNYTADEATVESNSLAGSVFSETVTGTGYVLANGNNGVGLYKAKLGENGTFKNNARKAYLPAPADGNAPAMFVFSRGGDDESTGIDQLINANGEVVIYDLAGRRVEKMEKGIYIVNGKKVVK